MVIVMINNYEVKKINNEEILYIYINDDYEFVNLNKGKKRKNFLKNICSFINKNDIKFAGSTIALVAGGLIIGNLFFNKSDDLNLKNCIISLHINPQIEISEVVSDDFLKTTSLNEKDKNEKNDIKEIINVPTNKENNNSLQKELKKENKSKETIKNEEKSETVTVFRSNGEVLNLELEDYLINVVAAEMPASFNIEALKAQSVLARTYAMKAIKSLKALTDTTSTQVYKDNNELKKTWGNNYSKYYEKIKNAVISTKGEVLKYNGDYIESVYHSTSNGMTEDAINVWGNSFPYLVAVDSSWDKTVKNYKVSTFFSYIKLSAILGYNIDDSTVFNIVLRNSSNRVSSVIIGDKEWTGTVFRGILGLRSADFEFEKVDDGINIITYGYGHGVGMSQYGANEMAKNGFNYKDILKHYYSGTILVSE